MTEHRNMKGQGAMEYLMTYSWAILIVVVIGMVLWQMGVFESGSGTTIATEWETIQPMEQTVVYSAADEHFEIVLFNTQGTTITITDVDINETYSGGACSNVTAGGITMPGSKSVSGGDLVKLNAICPAKNSEEAYEMQIQVGYNVAVGGSSIHKVETGLVSGITEA